MEVTHLDNLSDLGEVLIPFDTVRIKNSRMAFFNKHLGLVESDQEVLEACSFKILNNPRELLSSDRKIFYAERYGGDGILRNGGGGRCGYDGKYLVKGIGPNSLVGVNSDKDHADGRLTLHDAIYEAIWGEVIGFALPFGAIKTVAIILTDEKFILDGRLHHRALSVRESAVRPAHFLRALYYKEKENSGIEKDFRRVKGAIKKLVFFLPFDGSSLAGESLLSQIRTGFVELARRFAGQFAVARAKRILHYNVSASNVSIKGAWLDLTRTTIFSDYLIRDKLDVDRFVAEFTPALQSIRHISFYCYKYLGISRDDSRDLFKSAVYSFSKEYKFRLTLGLMAQAGFPMVIVTMLERSKNFNQMASLLQNVLDQEGYGVTQIQIDEAWIWLEFDVARIFKAMLDCCAEKNSESFHFEKSQCCPGFEVYEIFFNSVCEQALAVGITKKALIRGMYISLIKFSRTPRMLHLKDLDQAIEDLVGKLDEGLVSHDAVQAFIEDAVERAALCLKYDEGYSIVFWKTPAIEVLYSLKLDKFIVNTKVLSKVLTFYELMNSDFCADELKRAFDFYQKIRSVLW